MFKPKIKGVKVGPSSLIAISMLLHVVLGQNDDIATTECACLVHVVLAQNDDIATTECACLVHVVLAQNDDIATTLSYNCQNLSQYTVSLNVISCNQCANIPPLGKRQNKHIWVAIRSPWFVFICLPNTLLPLEIRSQVN